MKSLFNLNKLYNYLDYGVIGIVRSSPNLPNFSINFDLQLDCRGVFFRVFTKFSSNSFRVLLISPCQYLLLYGLRSLSIVSPSFVSLFTRPRNIATSFGWLQSSKCDIYQGMKCRKIFVNPELLNPGIKVHLYNEHQSSVSRHQNKKKHHFHKSRHPYCCVSEVGFVGTKQLRSIVIFILLLITVYQFRNHYLLGFSPTRVSPSHHYRMRSCSGASQSVGPGPRSRKNFVLCQKIWRHIMEGKPLKPLPNQYYRCSDVEILQSCGAAFMNGVLTLSSTVG